jgi:NADPH:quinone reductase-like Zn-dependent oxidoreductase
VAHRIPKPRQLLDFQGLTDGVRIASFGFVKGTLNMLTTQDKLAARLHAADATRSDLRATVGGALFEPALRSLRRGGRQVAISSAGDPRVSFSLVEFYHNSSRLLGVDSYGLTSQHVAEIEGELRRGFETGALTPPIEVVPFEKAVDAYSRVAARQARTRQVLSFDSGGFNYEPSGDRGTTM